MQPHPFDLLMELAEADIRLDCAALHLARDVYPHIDVHAYLGWLDEIAAEVAALRPRIGAPERYQALCEVLVERRGFHGNGDDYYDPDNSYLNRVLDRRCGIPISLATVWIEVGRRLNWPVSGVNLPGHFLVRLDDPERFVLVDVFDGGKSLSIEDCAELVKKQFDQKIGFTPEFLEPVDTRTILSRTLTNLKQIYMVNHNWERLLDVLRRLIAVDRENLMHIQELAALHYRMGDFRGAHALMAECLKRMPEPNDERASVQSKLHRLEAAIAGLN